MRNGLRSGFGQPFPIPKSTFRNRGVRLIEKWDRVVGYLLLIIGVVSAWSSTQLSMGRFRHPGPGFLPFGLSLALVLLSLALISSRWKRGKASVPFWPERTWVRPLLGVAILVFYALVVNWVGFLVTTFLFLIIWMGVIERLRWPTILSISAGTTGVLYLIFSWFLEVPLPQGFLKY